ncbi:ubiquitin carboxyl-terminal hydrolase 17-like isoform X1 [Glycine soja]|uniref:ubiquitinyl hydrolase 1 n=1 Tax=Glycine soja TaxID=3848 RepID=A0A445KYL0_GLYSO|nr:ubiquitin carboxyl-terminal hydrolase 17-like isoform X1 [Glycine soja]RZC15798.1 Ubiquitin carboxyl-terminal hydrolase 16 isoform A [Glycine soja]
MRVTGDLGFSSLVLVVVCVVLPVIGFLIRRKWQVSEARKDEIKRLLVLAAEETARAEKEASYEYGTAVSAAPSNLCAVCYFPATARCAQCKSVRYCSFECQTVHWRQGHKLECRPPSTTCWSDDVTSDHGRKLVEQGYSGIHVEKSESEGKECKIASEKSPISDICFSPKVSPGKDGNIRVESLAEGNITDSNSELSSNSFSGFSASTGSNDSSDDSSVCESIISNEHDGSKGHTFVDPTLDIPDNTSDDCMGVTMSTSPKFATLVDSVDGFSTMHKLNHTGPGFSKEESKLASNGNPGSSMWKGKTIEPSTVVSGFWDKALDSRGIKDDTKNDTHPSCSDESTGKRTVSESSFHFSFSTMSPLHVRDTRTNDSVSDDAFPNCIGNDMASSGSASSENDKINSSKGRNFSFINSKVSSVRSYVTPSGSESDQLESKDSSGPPLSSFSPQSSSVDKNSVCADALNFHILQSTGSKVSNHVVDNRGSTLKSTEIGFLTRELADSNLASGTEEHSHSSTKQGNNDIESGTQTVTSSQVASCSANSKSGLKTSVLKVVDQFRGSNLSKHFPLAVGSDIAGRHNDKSFFPYELFVKLYNSNKVELCPFGLINCGNSCYANAVLQCLAFTPPLTAYLLQGSHSKSCANKKWCFTCEFERLILKSKDTKSAVSPMGIISHLQNIGSQLANGREEDAHEFLRHVIDTMQSVCLMEAGVNALGSLEEDTTLMGQTFGGYLLSKIKCMRCGGKSERQERMMDLTVEIEGEITTLVEALRRFTSTETLDGENKYHCVRCKSYEKAKKKLTVSEAPNVLTVALKRFQSGKFGKLNKPIQFPEILNLAPFMSGTSDKSPIYRLYGVVVHLDIMNAAFSGHYVCYVKNIQNKWFKVDDSVVTAVELDRVLTKGAYMLFYARCSPRAPRLIRNRILSPDSKRKVSGKTLTTKARSISTNSGVAEHVNSSISPDDSPALDSFYSKFHHLKRILEEDSSSDNSSLISSNSDEGSCSTDSTRDSTSTDDFSEYLFGDSGNGWSSVWRNSDSDTSSSSSSSPLNLRHSPLSDMDRYDSVSPDAEGSRGIDVSRLSSNTTLQHRKLDSRISSNSSSSRETDSCLKLGSNHFNDIDYGVLCRKPRKRTDLYFINREFRS